MRVLSIKELMRLTRIELTDLYVRITNVLPDLPEGSIERQNALGIRQQARTDGAQRLGSYQRESRMICPERARRRL